MVKEDRKIKEKKLMHIMLLPVMLLLGVVPAIVRISEVNSTDIEQGQIFHLSRFYEYFAQYKARWIFAISIVILILWFFCYDKRYIKKENYTIVSIGGAGLLILGAVVSTVFSEHREIALWGVYNRAEGLIMILCYILMFTYMIYAFNTYGDILFIVMPLMFLILVNTFLGVMQYYDKDVFRNPGWILNLVVPDSFEDYVDFRELLCKSHATKNIYGTMFHYNYMGSFGAMMVPLFGTLFLFIKGARKKIALGITLLCSLFLLLGSTSRAGSVGCIIAVVILGVALVRIMMKHWRYSLAAILSLGILLVAFNAFSGGHIFSRIPSLVQDVATIVGGGSGEAIDYRDYLPIREFKSVDGEILVVLQNGELHFKLVQGEVQVTDQNGERVVYEHIVDEAYEELEGFEAYEGNYIAVNPDLSTIQYSIWNTYLEDGNLASILKIETTDGKLCFTCKLEREENKIEQIDLLSGKIIEQEEAPYIGFEGKERLGSARGYIWSRSLPILKETYLIGKGPDNFIFYFPRYDRLAKMWAYNGAANTIVDKPHNLYLQIGINEGCVALIGFLIMVGAYIVNSLRLYAFKREYSKEQVAGLAVMTSVIGYLVAGIFNDSMVSVAPIFWILLGTGVALNELNMGSPKESEEDFTIEKLTE